MDHQTAQQGNYSKRNSSSDEGNAKKGLPAQKQYEETGKIPELKQAGRKPNPIDKEQSKSSCKPTRNANSVGSL